MKCPHCRTALAPHDTEFGAKRGAQHCSGCGCCFLADGKTPREGVPVCDLAQVPIPAEPEPLSVSLSGTTVTTGIGNQESITIGAVNTEPEPPAEPKASSPRPMSSQRRGKAT